MDDYFDRNRALWDAWTPIHEGSNFYDLEGFRAGKSALKPIELEELGDVRGKALLHLQCHFGLDTLSWARLGADDSSGRSLQRPYFHRTEPGRFDVRGSYADPAAEFEGVSFEWTHSLSDVVNALVSAGLTLQKLNEFPYTPHPCFPFLEEREPRRWFVRAPGPDVPLVFSVRAVR
jgi:hypothetical protein